MNDQELYEFASNAKKFDGRRSHLLAAAKAAPKDGLHLEFGVYKGQSLRILHEMYPHRIYYGFDSFRGLPEAWDRGDGGGSHPEGHFRIDILPDIRNVELVVGYFQDTLPGFLADHPEKVAFAHIDCDLYSSTAFVLDQLTHRLGVGSVLVFDELIGWDLRYLLWRQGEFKALREWLSETGVTLEAIGRTYAEQASFRVLRPAIRLV